MRSKACQRFSKSFEDESGTVFPSAQLGTGAQRVHTVS